MRPYKFGSAAEVRLRKSVEEVIKRHGSWGEAKRVAREKVERLMDSIPGLREKLSEPATNGGKPATARKT